MTINTSSLAKGLCVASEQEKESENKVELMKGQNEKLMALLQNKDFTIASPSITHAQILFKLSLTDPNASTMSDISTNIPWIID